MEAVFDRLVCHNHCGDIYTAGCWKYYKESGIWHKDCSYQRLLWII